MRDGDYYVDDTMLKITVNGEPARVLVGSPYFPMLQFCGYRAWRRWRQSQEGEPVL